MLIKPNWEIFKAKFSKNPQDNFEWFCYLLFSKEYNQPYGIHRYKNQSGIETDPIEVNGEVIGWQSKFYEDSLSNHKEDLLGTLTKTKRDNPNITKIILYTNSEWGQGRGTKEPQAKIDTEEKAKELNIDLVWRSKSYFESPFVCQEQREISSYFFELNSRWKLTSYGFLDTLKSKYENDFKIISLLTNTSKPINDIEKFINLAIIKEPEEKKDNPKLTNREPILSSYEEIHKPKEPIAIKELINTSKKSLIYGKAGIGKTTLCKYISYKWAKGELYQEFEYIIYLPLREWKNRGIKGAIKDYYYSLDEKELNIDFNAYKILFLFDGYDELDSDKKKDLRDEIDKYALSHYIITTRPYGYQKSDFMVNEYFETIGFTDENVEKYIDAFFKENNDKAKSLKAYLETNISIKHIGYIPLMLEMICSQWEQKEFSESLTMTELYTQSVENIFFEYTEKNGTAYIQDKEKEIFNYLGKIAFEGLKQQTIILDKKIIKEKRSFFSDYVLKAGFLNDGKAEKSNPLLNSYQFPHLTFQEYFSALYVSKLKKKKIKKIIQKYKFYPHMQTFFAFLGGLIGDKKKDIEFLLSEIESEPRDILGYYETLIFSIIFTSLRKEKICTTRIENFNNDIQYWIEYIFTDNINFEILERLKNISHFLNKKTGYMLIRLVEKNSIFVLQNPNIIALLTHVGEKNDVIMDILIESLEQEPINFFSKRNMVKVLTSMNRDDEKYNDAMKFIKEHHLDTWNKKKAIKTHSDSPYTPKNSIESVINNTILSSSKDIANFLRSTDKDNKEVINAVSDITQDKNFRQAIAKSFADIERKDDDFINTLISYVNDKSIEMNIRAEISKSLASIADNSNKKKIIDTLISFITEEVSRVDAHFKIDVISLLGLIIDKNDKRFIDILKDDNIFLDLKYEVLNSLVSMGNNGEKFENIIIDVIRDNSIADNIKSGMIKPLVSMNRDDKKFIESLIFLIDKSTLPMNKKMLVNYLSKLTDKHNDIIFKKINVEEYSRIFIENSSMKSFCIAFDKEYIKLQRVIENAFFNGLPLYIKKNKLYTIENGKEISTQRKVDEATLNEIKMLLSKGDYLND